MTTSKSKENKSREPVIENRKARFEFTVLEKLEAGVVLKGSEVKSIREGGLELKESFVFAKKDALYLEGAYIKPYGYQGKMPLEAVRTRKLLLHKREIAKLGAEIQQAGMAIVPLKAYFKNGRVKLELGLGKGKKGADKRESIKKREVDRNLQRINKTHRK